jgi:two-component system vancomycin resistance sensor histidine kinase VraS
MIRHSNCTTAEISLKIEDNFLVMKIYDDGKGFDLPETTHGHGMRNMRQRTAEMNGTLNVQSSSGHGTRVTLRVPLKDGLFSKFVFRKSAGNK